MNTSWRAFGDSVNSFAVNSFSFLANVEEGQATQIADVDFSIFEAYALIQKGLGAKAD